MVTIGTILFFLLVLCLMVFAGCCYGLFVEVVVFDDCSGEAKYYAAFAGASFALGNWLLGMLCLLSGG